MARSAILSIRIVSDTDRARQGMRQTETSLQRFERGARRAAVPALALGAALLKIGSDSQQMRRTLQVATGATGDELDRLQDSARGVATSIPVTFEQAAEGIGILQTATGAAGDTLERLTAQVLNASRMLGEDGASNAEAFGQALNQWQIPAEQGIDLMDGLFKVTQDYGLGLDTLLGRLNRFSPVLQNAGFSVQEAAEFMGQLHKGGIDVSRIMPGLNRAFRTWAGEGKDARDMLEQTVLSIRNARDPMDALTIATETFGAEGAQRLTTAIRNNIVDLDNLGDALVGAGGLIDQTSQDTMTLAERFQLLTNQGIAAIEPVAERVFDAVASGLELILPLVENNTGALTGLVAVAAGLAAAVLVVNGALIAYRAIATVVTAVQWAMNAAFFANPIGLVVLAVAALIAVLIVAYNRSETFRNAVQTAGRLGAAAFRLVITVVTSLVGFVGNLISRVANIAGSLGVVRSLRAAFNAIVAPIMAVIRAVQTLIGAIGRIRFPSVPSAISRFLGEGPMPDANTVGGGFFTALPETQVMAEAGQPDVMAQGAPASFPAASGLAHTTIVTNHYDVRVEGATDPVATGEAIERAIRRMMRTTGGAVAVRQA